MWVLRMKAWESIKAKDIKRLHIYDAIEYYRYRHKRQTYDSPKVIGIIYL